MKNLVSYFLGFLLIGGIILISSGCTHDDQDLDKFIPTDTGGTNTSAIELVSKKTTTPPTIDAVIDGSWSEVQKLETRAVVPDPGNGVFAGYIGDAHEVTLRSMYDDQYIYFLAEWDDPNKDLNRQTWYYNPDTKRWAQENKYPTFNDNGVMTRLPFYEDKFAMLWNVNNSVADWSNTTCLASCHKDLSGDDGFVRHYTNGPTEHIDMWHWKSVRSDPNGQFDDQNQDNAQPNGRHSDSKESGGYSDNKQDLAIEGTGEMVKVPKYVIPDRSYYYWILQSEIDNGTAKLITSVDDNGILYYDGGTIDPTTETGYWREGSTTGALGIPSIYTTAFVGSRGDITGKGVYTGSGWVLEFKRKLDTGDTENNDINFTDLSDQPFGIGVFDNASIAHAIKPNLLLKFQ